MPDAIQGDQLRGHLETMILSILERDESYGFDIVKRLAHAGEGALNLKEGTIYPVLYRLEDRGLVKAKWEEKESVRRGPRRKIYGLTPKGRKQLIAARSEWTTFVNVIGAIVGGTI